MYCRYWELTESPFRPGPSPTFFHESPTHEEALARLEFLVEHRRRMGLLLGGAGTGKSLLLEVLARRLRAQRQRVALVNLRGLDPREFLLQIADQLQVALRDLAPTSEIWRALGETLTIARYEQRSTVLLIDAADAASDEVRDQIARLAELDRHPEARLTLVIAARTDHVRRLGERLLELCELRIELDRWSSDETAEFLETSLRKAGRTAPLFTPAAIGELQRLSGGVPRRISQLADLALLAGAGSGASEIDAETVASACQELAATPISR